MANYPITKDQLINASTDADTLEAVINGAVNRPNSPNPDGTVTTRLGTVIKTLSKAIADIVINNPDDAAVQALMQYFQSEFDRLGIHTRQEFTSTNLGYVLVYSIINELGQVPFGITTQGHALISSLLFAAGQQTDNNSLSICDEAGASVVTVNTQGDVSIGAVQTQSTIVDAEKYAFVICDKDGYIALGVTPNGQLVIPGVDQNPDGGLDNLVLKQTDIMHLFSYGQSLSQGGASAPALSTSPPANGNLTFASGVLTKGASGNYSSFKGLVEATWESPVSGFANDLSAKINRIDGSQWTFLGSAPGVGGQRVEQLNKGTEAWTDFFAQIPAAMNTANGQGKTYSVWGMCWIQGEADQASQTAKDTYKAALIQLKNDFIADSKSVTGQSFDPIFVMYQIGSHRGYSREDFVIAQAHWECSKEDEQVILACPMYMLDYNSDYHHLPNVDSQMMGKYMARAFYHTAFTGKRWRPFEPDSVFVQGRLVDITFHVPYGNIEIDTEWVAETPNYGFDLWSGTSVDTTAIASVQVASSNRVTIQLARDLAPGDYLTYAKGRSGDPWTSGRLTGPRGNLRDTSGYTDNYQIQGQTRYMHNWCVMFQHQF